MLKDFLIPKEKFRFSGSLEQLLTGIRKAGGKVQEGRRFTCPLPVSSQNPIEVSLVLFRSRGFIFFRVEGEYEPAEGGFVLRFRVVPTFAAVTAAFLPLAIAIAACRQFAGTDLALYPLWICGMATPLILLVLLWERAKETERFREFFRRQ